ncbi:MAG: hypothetical protein NC078_05045 [Ruminococcus sp.]|nr:hypothetical protein [Ruminococcus sp.]
MASFRSDDLERARRRAERREAIARKKEEVKEWVNNNKELIVTCAPLALGIAVKGVTAVNRSIRLKEERDNKELYCYDPSLGHYWRLRRRLNNSDWVQIDRRRQHGERMADILSDLKVLK